MMKTVDVGEFLRAGQPLRTVSNRRMTIVTMVSGSVGAERRSCVDDNDYEG